MKPTKEILKLIEKREKYGALANSYDHEVIQWCKKHNVDIDDIMCDYGCMLTTEPIVYAQLTIDRIKSS